MLITTFKRNTDLNNLQNNPFIYNKRPTLDHLKLLLHETMFPRWVLNTAFAGLVVVITLLIARRPRRLRAGATHRQLGRPTRHRHLPDLPDPPNAPVHPPVKGRRPPRPAGLPLVDHHRLPQLHNPLLDLSPDGLLHREADDPDVDLRHPHRGHLRLHPRDAGVRLRPDLPLLLRQPDRRRRRSHVPPPRRRLLLGLAHGRLPDHEPADRDSVQPVSRSVHRGVHGGGGEAGTAVVSPPVHLSFRRPSEKNLLLRVGGWLHGNVPTGSTFSVESPHPGARRIRN